METDTFYRDFMVKSISRLSGVFMEKTWLIKLAGNRHTNFTVKSPLMYICLHTVSILAALSLHIMETKYFSSGTLV